MTTRAKFVCRSVEKFKNTYYNATSDRPFCYNAKFNVVYNDSPENEKFFQATPSGNIELSSYVSDMFEPGKEYYVDFTEAVKGEQK